MPSTFVYPERLSPAARNRLERREQIIDEAFEESTHFEWTVDTGDGSEKWFTLTKRGLVDTLLERFSEPEIDSLSDRDFANRISAYDVEDERARSKDYVQERIAAWVSRLEALFDTIESWVPEDWNVMRNMVIQRNEELMQKYSVTPRDVPTLSVVRAKQRIGLVPSALWLIGADGRVNITTNRHQYILVDRRKNHESSSDWQIVLGKRRTETVPFTQEIFTGLLEQA